MEEHTGFTPWMLTTPYSLKLLSSLLWEEASRNTRNCSKPWSTQKGLSFPKRFSGIQKSSTFPHGSEHTQSVWLKAVLQSEFKGITYVLNLVNSKLKKKNLTNTHTHTLGHTQTKVLIYSSSTSDQISSLHLLNYNVQKVRQQDSRVHSITSHNANERFSFKDSYAYPKSGYTQWVWNSGYSKNFYKEQTN
jgi:hypothetical protein